MHGILLLDKPCGMSSNAALQEVKHLYDARKAGHTGSLDVPATGLLPVCLGEATKVSGYLLDARKSYRSDIKLGTTTTTGDATGDILQQRVPPSIDANTLQQALRGFVGEIEQVPPMHSAIKHQGRRLYDLAYQGMVVERKPRKVTIYSLEVIACAGERLSVQVECSKGTYIRVLAEDIGKALGCGACVSTLRRTGVGDFKLAEAKTLMQLRQLAGQGVDALDRMLLPPDSALSGQPDVALTIDASFYLQNGQPVAVAHAPTRGLVRLYDQRQQFLGIGQVLADGRIAPRRLVNVNGQSRINDGIN